MLGRWVSDLEVGDKLGPLDYEVSPFLIREYLHSVEDASERHQGAVGLLASPTMVHADKKALFDAECPQGSGPAARLHLVYDAVHHRAIPAGRTLQTAGEVVERFERKGREHVVLEIEVRDKQTGVVYTTYRDTSLLNYRARAE